jgi:heat shock factor-binding protein 1
MSDQIIGRLDDMGKRVDDLEKNINELMQQVDTREEPSPKK